MASAATQPTGPSNRLAGETSPYLRQHERNPVDWYPWGAEALDRARAEDKPILLSVGYAACHWCHVMAHESFEDPQIAEAMNRLFVNIKVDREERPDLDQIYQTALALMGERGGWPLTIFLTPDAEPFWGGTYFPPTARWGRPGFVEVIGAMAAAYARDRDKVANNAAALREGLSQLAEGNPGAVPTAGLLNAVAIAIGQMIDTEHGGLRGAPKFPQCGLLELLWRAWRRTGISTLRDGVTLSATAMCEGGIYDHVGGGFARYSTDERWLAPHFEKMLYDNAELVHLLTLLWKETRDPLYARRVEETIGWLQREMMNGDGFAGSLDADSEGEEGRFYVWTAAEVDAVLGSDAALFARFYDVEPGGNWEGHVILNRRAAPQVPSDADEARLRSCLQRLLAARDGRERPGRDHKVLADWNGLMIAALAHAGEVFARPDWLALASRAFAFALTHLVADGRLRHSWCEGQARHPATLDDHASLARAALALHAATGDEAYLDRAAWLAELVDRHFADSARGGYYFAADDTADVLLRARTATDHATPSGNGMMAAVLTQLWLCTGREDYRQRAESVFTAFSGDLARQAVGAATLLNAADLYEDPVEIIIAGPIGDAHSDALARAAAQLASANTVRRRLPPGAALPDGHPAGGKGLVDGQPAVYVCRRGSCSLPVTDPAALAAVFA